MQQRGHYRARPWGAERKMALVVLVLLAAQYASGQFMNLYVHLPDAGRESPMSMGVMMAGNGWLTLHIALAVALVAGGIVATLVATTIGARTVAWSLIGLAGLVLGAGSGMGFLMSNQSNLASLLMSLGWLVAAAGYVGLLASPSRQETG